MWCPHQAMTHPFRHGILIFYLQLLSVYSVGGAGFTFLIAMNWCKDMHRLLSLSSMLRHAPVVKSIHTAATQGHAWLFLPHWRWPKISCHFCKQNKQKNSSPRDWLLCPKWSLSHVKKEKKWNIGVCANVRSHTCDWQSNHHTRQNKFFFRNKLAYLMSWREKKKMKCWSHAPMLKVICVTDCQIITQGAE